jgi:hypothetical protein
MCQTAWMARRCIRLQLQEKTSSAIPVDQWVLDALLCRQLAIKVVARLAVKVDESIRKRHNMSREDLVLMT